MSVTFERRNEMPRFDGTGPNGQGPITGRGMVRGRGHGCKGGMGKARGFCANAQK